MFVLRKGLKLALAVSLIACMSFILLTPNSVHPLWLLGLIALFIANVTAFPEYTNKYYWQQKFNTLTYCLCFWRWYTPRRYKGLNEGQLRELIGKEIREKYQRR